MRTLATINAEITLAEQAYEAGCADETRKEFAYRREHGRTPLPAGWQVKNLAQDHPASVRLASLRQELAFAEASDDTQAEPEETLSPELRAAVDIAIARASAPVPLVAAAPKPPATYKQRAELLVREIVGEAAYRAPVVEAAIPPRADLAEAEALASSIINASAGVIWNESDPVDILAKQISEA